MKSPGDVDSGVRKDIEEDIRTAWKLHDNSAGWFNEKEILAGIRYELQAHTYLLTAIAQALLDETIE